MKVIAIDNSNFDVEVLQSSLPVLVDFYADWCGPCKMVGPMIEELANEYDGKFKFCKVNVDDAQDLAVKFGIMSIPTVLFFKNGEKVNQFTGAMPKDNIKVYVENILD